MFSAYQSSPFVASIRSTFQDCFWIKYQIFRTMTVMYHLIKVGIVRKTLCQSNYEEDNQTSGLHAEKLQCRLTFRSGLWSLFYRLQRWRFNNDVIRKCTGNLSKNILFEIFIFCPKILLWYPEKIVNFYGWKCCGLDFLAVDNFDFSRKIVKKNLGEKLVKMLWFF